MLHSARVWLVCFCAAFVCARVRAAPSSSQYTPYITTSMLFSLFRPHRSRLPTSALRHVLFHQERSCANALTEQCSKLLGRLNSHYLFASALFTDPLARARFAQSVTESRLFLRTHGCDTGAINYELHAQPHPLKDIKAMVYYELDDEQSFSAQRTVLFPACVVRKIGKRIILKHTRRADESFASRLSGEWKHVHDLSDYGSTSIFIDVDDLAPLLLAFHLHCTRNLSLSRPVYFTEAIPVRRVRQMLGSVEFNTGRERGTKGRSFMTTSLRWDDEA